MVPIYFSNDNNRKKTQYPVSSNWEKATEKSLVLQGGSAKIDLRKFTSGKIIIEPCQEFIM